MYGQIISFLFVLLIIYYAVMIFLDIQKAKAEKAAELDRNSEEDIDISDGKAPMIQNPNLRPIRRLKKTIQKSPTRRKNQNTRKRKNPERSISIIPMLCLSNRRHPNP